MRPILPQGTLGQVHLVVIIHIPSIIIISLFLSPLIFYLWVAVLELTFTVCYLLPFETIPVGSSGSLRELRIVSFPFLVG